MWQERTHPSKLLSVKHQRVDKRGRRSILVGDSPNFDITHNLVGKSTDVSITIEGQVCQALLDSGSMVSTISEEFCQILKLSLHPLDDLINVEGAGGHIVHYLGYVEAKIDIGSPVCSSLNVLLLVVPQTRYHQSVPVLLGTNVLQMLVPNLQKHDKLDSPWSTVLICMTQLDDSLTVKTTKVVKVLPGESITFKGFVRTQAVSNKMCVIPEESSRSFLPGGLIIRPDMHTLVPGKSSTSLSMQVQNIREKPVSIPANYRFCCLHQVHVVSSTEDPTCVSSSSGSTSSTPPSSSTDSIDSSNNFMEQLKDLDKELSPSQLSEVKELILRWKGVFSLHDLDLGSTSLVKHSIRMSDETPFKERHRRIPPAMVQEVRQHLQEMLDQGVIRPSCSPFASPCGVGSS